MSNILEYKDKLIVHPGYYIKEIIEESGLTQEDFAKRLDTTPKNLSVLVRGEQALSLDIAAKLARMLGTSVEYWLNLQNAYDAGIAEMQADAELEQERIVFKHLDYRYFREHWGLPPLPRQTDAQIKAVRETLGVSSLTVLKNEDMAVSFRTPAGVIREANVVRANALVQLAIREARKSIAPKFNKKLFERAVDYALTLTKEHNSFFRLVRNAFYDAGVVLVVLPNLPGSKIYGATKKLGDNVMLMVNDSRSFSDTFWFTLLHEVGHIMNGDYGITFADSVVAGEDAADTFAADKLVPPEEYRQFIYSGRFCSAEGIAAFAEQIGRDPGIVLGRLQNDGYISHSDKNLNERFKRKYQVVALE